MGLDNDAFRKFLEEKKPAAQKKHKQPKKKPASTGKHGKKPGAADEEDDGPKYRDRADERRRGITVEESAPSFLTAEETRYLGGSMDRTHLVRGLDRLLLNQVRGVNANQDAAEEAEEIKAAPSAEAQPALPTHFKSSVGRAVANCLLKPPSSNVAELFQPKRMAFVYFGQDAAGDSDEDEGEAIEWGGDTDITSIPETLLRSKADCPVPPDAMNAAADAAVLTEVVGVMKAVKIESKHRGKDRRRNNSEADAATAAVRHSTPTCRFSGQISEDIGRMPAAKIPKAIIHHGVVLACRMSITTPTTSLYHIALLGKDSKLLSALLTDAESIHSDILGPTGGGTTGSTA